VGRAIVSVIEGKDSEAEKDVDQALTIAPRSASAHVAKGLLFLARGGEAAAEPVFEQALALDSTLTPSIHRLKKAVLKK
jgi:Tfp pilus assembly protein PilF